MLTASPAMTPDMHVTVSATLACNHAMSRGVCSPPSAVPACPNGRPRFPLHCTPNPLIMITFINLPISLTLAAKIMLQHTTSNIFSRLILSYIAIGLVTVLAPLWVIKSLNDDTNSQPIILEQGLFELNQIESLSDHAAQKFFTYLLNGFEEELTGHREAMKALPAKYDSFASTALLFPASEGESAEEFLLLKQNWKDFTSNAEIIVTDFQRSGIVSPAKLLAVEESLSTYQKQMKRMIEHQHASSQQAVIRLDKIIQDAQFFLLISAILTLAALVLIATLMTRQVKRFIISQEASNENLRQQSTALQTSQAQTAYLAEELAAFIEALPAATISVDTDGLIKQWNQAATRMTGYEKKEIINEGFQQTFIPEPYRALFKEKQDSLLQGEAILDFMLPLHTKKGDQLDISLHTTAHHDKDGNVIGAIAVCHDLSEATRASNELERLAEELTQFINTANAPIFGIDAQCRINEWNQTAAKITGYKKQEVLGKDLVEEFITEDYKKSVRAVLESALQGIETSNYEFPLYTSLGVRVDVLLNATTRRDTNGEITGVIGVGQDISEVKSAQAALQQAQKMEVVGQLTGGIAHDFNNLLTVISGNLTFLKDELDVVSTDVAEIIGDAQSAANDGAELTHRLLAFARQQILEPKETLVNDLILNTSRLMGRTLGEDIKITTALDSKNPVVMVDRGQLESALMNLCINARDAMQSGGSLAITSETISIGQDWVGEFKDLTPGKYAIVSVEDSGTGMSEKEIGQVFEPFYTTKEPGKGSGLGLSMVHGFVTQSRGTVVIESEQGTGSKVKLYLPDFTASINTLPPPIETTFSMGVANGTEKILVVDDEPRVRKTAVRVLRKLGYEVIEAGSGEEALASMEKNEDIDLLFSDIMMPGGMNGRELASIVSEKYPKVKIQLTTGYENVDATMNSIDGDLPLLRKPYDREELSNALRKRLDGLR